MNRTAIRRKLMWTGLFGAMTLIGESEVQGEEIQRPAVTVTRVQNKGHKALDRAEVYGKLPSDLDYYGIVQEQGASKYGKVSLSYVPLKTGFLGLGTTVQHKKSTAFPAQDDIGVMGRMAGSLSDGTYVKMDVKYFPHPRAVDWYGFIDSDKLYADIVGSYQLQTGRISLQPGIDYKVNKNFAVGIEGKLTGEGTNLGTEYVGIRLKLTFR